MQGIERVDRQLLDAGALVGHLVPAGSMFAFLAAHRGELFGDEDFADLFPSGRGRPSVPASVMASVMVLQVLHDYSDAEAAEAARCDLRWKAACGFPLDHRGIDPSKLVLATAPGPLQAPAPDQRGGREGDRADPGTEGPSSSCGGLDDPGGCGGDPAHHYPSWSLRSAGWPGWCRGRRGRSRSCAPMSRRARRPGSSPAPRAARILASSAGFGMAQGPPHRPPLPRH
jgi:hypothetical protein